MRRVRVVTDRRSNPRELAGRDRRAHTGAADQDPALRVAGSNSLADLARLVRVVHRLVAVGPEVDRLVAQRAHLVEDALPELHAPVVEGNRNAHRSSTLLPDAGAGTLAGARTAAARRRRARECESGLRASHFVHVG